jgi:hypothetical protein
LHVRIVWPISGREISVMAAGVAPLPGVLLFFRLRFAVSACRRA